VVTPQEETDLDVFSDGSEGVKEDVSSGDSDAAPEPTKKGKVVSLMDRRKKDHSS
jgi:hypothetical protein